MVQSGNALFRTVGVSRARALFKDDVRKEKWTKTVRKLCIQRIYIL